MNSRINSVLEDIRGQMESAWGPEVPGVSPETHDDGSPGEGEADNISDTDDNLDMYLFDIADQLMVLFDIDEGDSLDFVFDCADELAKEGELPKMPDEGADPEEVAAWMGKATSMGFGSHVMQMARDAGTE